LRKPQHRAAELPGVWSIIAGSTFQGTPSTAGRGTMSERHQTCQMCRFSGVCLESVASAVQARRLSFAAHLMKAFSCGAQHRLLQCANWTGANNAANSLKRVSRINAPPSIRAQQARQPCRDTTSQPKLPRLPRLRARIGGRSATRQRRRVGAAQQPPNRLYRPQRF
jgi:hypothetical protein